MDATAGEPMVLLPEAFDADWSPDGNRIAFVRHVRTEARQVSNASVPPSPPAAAHDGRRFAFVRETPR